MLADFESRLCKKKFDEQGTVLCSFTSYTLSVIKVQPVCTLFT